MTLIGCSRSAPRRARKLSPGKQPQLKGALKAALECSHAKETVVSPSGLSDTAFEISSLTSSTRCAHGHEAYRSLRDGSFGMRCPRHFVPGYDHAVPPGQNTFQSFIAKQIRRARSSFPLVENI